MEVAEDELMMIVWEGWLKKKTQRGVVKIWQSRYFRLLGDVLEYYKSDRLGSCSGMIPLQMMSGLHLHPPSKKGGCRFDILLDDGVSRRVFSLLAPHASVCEKLVRSIRNMLHHPVDESARMDIATIDTRGQFWKKIDEIERRRTGASRKGGHHAEDHAGGGGGGGGLTADGRRRHSSNDGPESAALSRLESSRSLVDTANADWSLPSIRVLKELQPLALGQLYLARDADTKMPYYMHVVNKPALDDELSSSSGAHAAATTAADRQEALDLWAEMSRITHPFVVRHASNGDCADRAWMLYTFPLHAPLSYHVAALVQQREDALALRVLADPMPLDHLPSSSSSSRSSQSSLPSLLLPVSVLEHLSCELLLLLEYLHQRDLLAVHLDLAHLALTDRGHIQLVDFFLAANKEGKPTKRREKKEDRYCTPEFLRGEMEDYRADYWRFGLILYELLTGRLPAGFTRPYELSGAMSILRHVRTYSLAEEDQKEEEDEEDDEHGESMLFQDPLTPEQRLRANIDSFDPTNEFHLPFPEEASPEIASLIRGCLQPVPLRRLGGSQASTTRGGVGGTASSTLAASRISSIAALQGHRFHARVNWEVWRQALKHAMSDPILLAPAPPLIFDTLLHAAHNRAHAQSTLVASIVHEHKLHVVVKAGRHFRRDHVGHTDLASPGGSGSGGVYGSSGGGSSGPSFGGRVGRSSVATKFYIKVLVDGKALKTDICDSARGASQDEWSWNKRMVFKADEGSLDTELIARVMAHDEDSYHDATIGAVAIPLRHVYQQCSDIERRAERKRTAPHASGVGGSVRGSVTDEDGGSSFDGWFSVIDRDGFDVGELRLGFQLGPSNLGRVVSMPPPMVSRRTFAHLFGAEFSSEDLRERTHDTWPSEATFREIGLMQQEPVPSEEAITPTPMAAITTADEAELEEPQSARHVRRRVNSIDVPVSLQSSIGASARASMRHRRPMTTPTEEEEEGENDEDEDEDDDERATQTAMSLMQIAALTTNDRRRSNVAASAMTQRRASVAVTSPTSPTAPIVASPTLRRKSIVAGAMTGMSALRRGSVMVGSTATTPSLATANAVPPPTSGAAGFLRGIVSKKKFRFQEKGFDLDLSYIGDRLIAMGFPSEGSEAAYRNPMSQVQHFFRTFHAGAYKVYNLCSERQYEHAKFEQVEGGRVAEYPFDDHNPPPFHKIVDFCVDVNGWLAASGENVAAVHCKAGKGRTGLMVSCYLLYCGTCLHPDAALDYFAVRRTINGKGVTIPSQIRYVHYFHRYLIGYFDLNRPFPFNGVSLLLTHVRVTGIPRFDLVSGGCDPFFTILQGSRVIYDFQQAKLRPGGALSRSGASGGLISTGSMSGGGSAVGGDDGGGREFGVDHVDFKLFVHVRADFKLLLYERDRLGRAQKIAWFWLHTAFLHAPDGRATASYVCLKKSEIDGALKDKESKHFPPHFKVELFFQPSDTTFKPPREPDDNRTIRAREHVAEAYRQEVEAAEVAGVSRPPVPTLPFDVPSSIAAQDLCHARTVQDYELFQAEQVEAAMLFQPE